MSPDESGRARFPVEPKVKAGATGSALAGFVLWLLARYVFHVNTGDVPAEVAALVALAVPYAAAWVAGYVAPHFSRTGFVAARRAAADAARRAAG